MDTKQNRVQEVPHSRILTLALGVELAMSSGHVGGPGVRRQRSAIRWRPTYLRVRYASAYFLQNDGQSVITSM